jgi:hypothetical protein
MSNRGAKTVDMVQWHRDKRPGEEILDRVLSWPADDQEKVARFVREVEQRRAGDDISDEEWAIIEARAARRDLATDEEVEKYTVAIEAHEASVRTRCARRSR